MGPGIQSLPETAIVLVPTTIITAYIGAQIQSFVDRSKIAISILGCHITEEAKVDSCEIDIDKELIKKINRSRWLPIINSPVTARQVIDCITKGKAVLILIHKALPFLGSKIENISDVAVPSDNEKKRFINEIFSSDHMGVIDGCLTGGLARRELILSSPDE